MPPGPKRKGANRSSVDSDKYKQRNFKSNAGRECKSQDPIEVSSEKVDYVVEDTSKYGKGKISSNWNRYDEPVIDNYADVKRGGDYEVLLGNSGGAGSQIRLQEEKDWDENKADASALMIDFNRLGRCLKCIPFHKRLDIPEDVFDPSQIDNFIRVAESNMHSFVPSQKIQFEIPNKIPCELLVSRAADSIDIPVVVEDEVPIVKKEPEVVPKETENLIQSLASCLTIQENDVSSLQREKVLEPPPIINDDKDDLDFLLSLSVTTNAVNTAPKDIKSSTKVDDWLDSILDD